MSIYCCCGSPCPGGRYQRDSQGCETCTCQPVSPVPVCSLLDCGNVVCDFGREIVNGCPTCRCKPAETTGDVQQAQCVSYLSNNSFILDRKKIKIGFLMLCSPVYLSKHNIYALFGRLKQFLSCCYHSILRAPFCYLVE